MPTVTAKLEPLSSFLPVDKAPRECNNGRRRGQLATSAVPYLRLGLALIYHAFPLQRGLCKSRKVLEQPIASERRRCNDVISGVVDIPPGHSCFK